MSKTPLDSESSAAKKQTKDKINAVLFPGLAKGKTSAKATTEGKPGKIRYSNKPN